MFAGRKLLIATIHEKEKAIAPILEKELGVECFTSQQFNTDLLGTFSGEIERKEDPLSTLRTKCSLAMELSNCDLAIASEGSFGQHPSLFFVPANEEFVLLMDKKNNLEIIEREISTETNFNASNLSTEIELIEFAEKVKFPSHGLIIRRAKDDYQGIEKGITDWFRLKKISKKVLDEYGSLYVETDMRAMYNPTRMAVIESVTQKLVAKINSVCPECETPGFGITDAKQGLPCKNCSFPTRSTLSVISTCAACSFTKQLLFPNNKQTEDPMFCDFCNP